MDIRHLTAAVSDSKAMAAAIALIALALAVAVAWAPAAGAVTVVKCVDAEGEVSFRDSCPPEMTKQGEKKLRGTAAPGSGADEEADSDEITLYVVEDCEPCVLMREVLAGRNVPFTELDVGTDPDIQEKLRQRSGALKVPTVAAGKHVITGYSRDKLEAALDELGFAAAAEP